MKQLFTIFFLVSALIFSEAEAKRFGGGKSFGRQSSNVTNKTPPASPQKNSATNNNQGQPQKSGLFGGGMMGGLLAGLGLGLLASHLGIGEGLLTALMIGGLVLAGFALISFLKRKSLTPATAGAGAGIHNYNPASFGNDASARPWENKEIKRESIIGSGINGNSTNSFNSTNQSWYVPNDFDEEGFLKSAKDSFIKLQAAWDKADLKTLSAMTTDEMLVEIKSQLKERQGQNITEVTMVNSKLLGMEDVGDLQMVSVEFFGFIKENETGGSMPFREIWNMIRPKDNSHGWLVAGLQTFAS